RPCRWSGCSSVPARTAHRAPWRPRRTAPNGMPRRSWRQPLHPPKPPRLALRSLRPHSAIQTQAPARPADDDRYSSIPPFFLVWDSFAATLAFVEHLLRPIKHGNDDGAGARTAFTLV